MKTFFRTNLITMIGVAVGGLSGYLYWYFIGCLSGTCPITSNPLISTVYGSILGGLFFSMFKQPDHEANTSVNKIDKNTVL